MKNQLIVMILASVLAVPALAADLKLRNVRLVDTGHTTSIVGTVVNASDHMVKGGYLDVEVSRNNRVVARETVEVPDMDVGQAWRIWQPVQHSGEVATAAVRARDPHISITAAVVPYPGTLVAQ
ncbi:FxLYD domain-containing protein [Pseudomonas sp. RIT-PI-S]|uniref:FxLYD domain-containing protein n=1 Tax=Pseudomonas sp. RIT-PI-S TaxID=3035295 RepID=UPI0021D861FE|nr:FxLYD domain-containing protein [Pseudomonas sp. RIT-PI-S]